MKNTMFRSGYVIKDQYATHFMTFTVCGWIDLLTRKVYKDIIIDAFKYCQQEKGLIINAFVIMTNHIHLIARATDSKNTLSDIVRDFKKHTHHTMMPVSIVADYGEHIKSEVGDFGQHTEKR
ncbi:MAG: transposase [Agriterribacter sp.]